MRVLCLEPYLGGSHAAFLQGWAAATRRHSLTVEGLPARHWKWRMRHAAVTLADRLREQSEPGQYEAVIASDMLDLATFRALAPPWIAGLPTTLYLHENQLGYPDERATERDLHFGLTNLTSCLAADRVLANSEWHVRSFREQADRLAQRMPDRSWVGIGSRALRDAAVAPPGIAVSREPGAGGDAGNEPLHIVWVARHEADKQPDVFAAAIGALLDDGAAIRVSILGDEPRPDGPFAALAERLQAAGALAAYGFAADRSAYEATLAAADLVVSTAAHEYFGIAILEAIALGCAALVPNALAYPETLAGVCADDEARAAIVWHEAGRDAGSVVAALRSAVASPPSTAARTRAAAIVRAEHGWEPAAEWLDGAIAGEDG